MVKMDAEKVSERLNRVRARYNKEDGLARRNVIEALVKHAEGRQFLNWLLSISHAIGENAHTGHALTTAFNCGQQNVGQQIMAELLASGSETFYKVLKENEDVRNRRDSELRSIGDGDGSGGADEQL